MRAGAEPLQDGRQLLLEIDPVHPGRGVISARTERSPSSITRAIMRVSCGSTEPALSPSATSIRISSSVTAARLLVAPEQAQDQPRGDLEQPYKGRGAAGERRHRRRHEGGDALGFGERDLLRHELADDQREVGDDRDYDGYPDRAGGPRPEAERL